MLQYDFDTLIDRAQNSCKTNMNSGLKSRGRLVYSFYGAIVYRLGHLVFIQASGVRFPVALPKISRQSPNANPVGDELTRLCRCSQYIVGAVPTGNRIPLLLSLK